MGELDGKTEGGSHEIVSVRLTCLCSGPMLQCAAVQMMSSPPAACCSECDARPLQREDGGRNEWEGRGAAIGEGRTKHNCDETVTLSASSYSLVYSLVTVRERGHGHTFRADCDMLC